MKKLKRAKRYYYLPKEEILFTKYRNLKKYVAEQNNIPIEALLDVTLEELQKYVEVRRVKVWLNRKGQPLSVVGDADFDLTKLVPEDA